MLKRTIRDDFDVTVPDPGDLLFPEIPVESIMAYSVGRVPLSDDFRRLPEKPEEDDGLRVRVAQVKVDGQWVPL